MTRVYKVTIEIDYHVIGQAPERVEWYFETSRAVRNMLWELYKMDEYELIKVEASTEFEWEKVSIN